MEEGGLPTNKDFTVEWGRKLCIYVKWKLKQNPIGSKCLNQCTNQNPISFMV